MEIIHQEPILDHHLILIILKKNELKQWKSIASFFLDQGMIIKDLTMQDQNEGQPSIKILQCIHRNDPTKFRNFLNHLLNSETSPRTSNISSFQPKTTESSKQFFNSLFSSHCNEVATASSLKVVLPLNIAKDNWLMVMKDDDQSNNPLNILEVSFLDEKKLFIQEMIYRIRELLDLNQLRYHVCKNLPEEITRKAGFIKGKKRLNLLFLEYPPSTINLISILKLIQYDIDPFRQQTFLREFFIMLGRSQFYCYWLGQFDLNDSIQIDPLRLTCYFTKLKQFYSPLSNTILLQTYQQVEMILTARDNNDNPDALNLTAEWDYFREGLRLGATRLQNILENNDVKKELLFLLKTYQHTLRFPSDRLERMLDPSSWFKIY